MISCEQITSNETQENNKKKINNEKNTNKKKSKASASSNVEETVVGPSSSSPISFQTSNYFNKPYNEINNSNNEEEEEVDKEEKELKSYKLRKYCCRISILFPLIFISIASATFLSVFFINMVTTHVFSREMNANLVKEVSVKIIERLSFTTSLPPKVIYLLEDLHEKTSFTQALNTTGIVILNGTQRLFPEISTVSLSNSETNEEVFYERLPNGTLLFGHRYPDSMNDTTLYRYQMLANNNFIKREGWGPVYLSENYITSNRTWFKRCYYQINHWTQPYPYSNGQFAIGRCSSIFSIGQQNTKSKFLGIVTADLTLANLNVFLASFRIGKKGYSFITDRNGYLIASSIRKASDIGSINERVHVSNISEKAIRVVGSYFLSTNDNSSLNDNYGNFEGINATTFGKVSIGGVNHFVEVSPFIESKNLDWLVFVVLPNTDYLLIINTNYFIVIGITFAMILISFLLSLLFCYSIIKPLKKLKSELKLVKQLNLEPILFQSLNHHYNNNTNNNNNNHNNNYFNNLFNNYFNNINLYEVYSIKKVFRSMIFALQSFKKYVPEIIISRSLRKKQVATLFLVEREGVVIFLLDFVDFTKLTEELTPVKLVELIGEALEEMTLLIEEQGGVIDKYIGDAIMAIFTSCGNSTGSSSSIESNNSNNGSGIGSSNSSGSANSNNNSNNSMVVSDSGNVGNVSGNKANNVKFANSTAGGGSSNDNLTQNNSSATNNNNNCSTVTITTTNNNNNSINNNNTSNNNGSINNCCEARACHAILNCINKLKERCKDWNRRGLPNVQCRIGVHCGKVLIGNFGSSKRLNYTALGTTVNLASYLEPLCKLYGTNNLISNCIYEKVYNQFCCKFIDLVIVKSNLLLTAKNNNERYTDNNEQEQQQQKQKQQQLILEVYEVLCEKKVATVEMLEMERITCVSLRNYLLNNDLKQTLELIKKTKNIKGFEKDKALNVLKKRCKQKNENCTFNGIILP
ncbi:hypothetical protein ABK040_009662 [Willaertia magna]